MKKQMILRAGWALALSLLVSAYFTGVEVREGETVPYVNITFGEADINGTVTGDVECFMCELKIGPSGVVQGKVSTRFADVSSEGEIHDISISMSDARISGKVLGNMKIQYASVELEENASVSGNIEVYRSNLEVSGKVSGTVNAQESNIELGEMAEIAGELVLVDSHFEGRSEQVAGGIRKQEAPSKPHTRASVRFLSPSSPRHETFFFFLLSLILTLLIVFLFYRATGFSQHFSTRAQAGLSLLAGFLSLMAFIPSVFFLALTIVGIPLIPFVFALYIGGLFFGWAVMCRKTGNWFFSLLRLQVHDLLDTFVGFLLLSLLIVIPFVGFFFLLLFLVFSLGIFARYLWGVLRPKPAPPSQPTG